MAVITKNREIRADADSVWQILVDWENERKYWSNERDIRVLASEGMTIEREATVGPRGFDQKTLQKILLEPKKSIKLLIQGDHISGERNITVVPVGTRETRVEVAWNLTLKGVPGFVEGIMKNQLSSITEDALKKIARVAETETA